ncbi:MAG: DinB family protein [Herpetosiphonaceae bacterium]|nr:DinB family protein [Herpetosiphonaceae bacterium]
MNIITGFLQRYIPLTTFWHPSTWEYVSADLMRQRPHPRVNSIAWNMWHLTRVEDSGLSRFVVDRPQVLDEGGWMERMNLPWRHHGGEMSLAEVDELNGQIDLAALRAYMGAVQARTLEIVNGLDPASLDAAMEEDRLRLILLDEGLAHPRALGLVTHYRGWTKGMCLLNFGLTHPYQHVGEIGVIAGLLGVNFD